VTTLLSAVVWPQVAMQVFGGVVSSPVRGKARVDLDRAFANVYSLLTVAVTDSLAVMCYANFLGSGPLFWENSCPYVVGDGTVG